MKPSKPLKPRREGGGANVTTYKRRKITPVNYTTPSPLGPLPKKALSPVAVASKNWLASTSQLLHLLHLTLAAVSGRTLMCWRLLDAIHFEAATFVICKLLFRAFIGAVHKYRACSWFALPFGTTTVFDLIAQAVKSKCQIIRIELSQYEQNVATSKQYREKLKTIFDYCLMQFLLEKVWQSCAIFSTPCILAHGCYL